MNQQKQSKSKKLTQIAFALGIIVCAIIMVLLITLAVKRINRTGALGSAPNYVVDDMTVWNAMPMPSADQFLTEEGRSAVSIVSFQTAPLSVIGVQNIGIQLQFSDGTTRAEAAKLTILDSVLIWEMGTADTAAALLGDAYADAVFSKPIASHNTPGTYSIGVIMADQTYDFTLIVQDTVKPAAIGKASVKLCTNDKPTPLDFLEQYTDASAVTIGFATEPDTAENGEKIAVIRLTDTAGNETLVEVPYTVTGDDMAPVISGYSDTIQTVKGIAVSPLHGVTAEDKQDGAVEVTASMTANEIKALPEGTHMLTYSAKDEAGNVTDKNISVIVLPSDTEPSQLTDEDIFRMGYAIVESVLTEDMDETTRARKLYNYVQGHMFYKDNKENLDWTQAAYLAINRAYGDCRNYYAYARLLLTCAGFENIMVEHTPSSPTASRHFWNLVVIDGVWYHFDTTPRVGQSNFFMWTDAQMDAYSKRNGNCFARDESLYPASPSPANGNSD